MFKKIDLVDLYITIVILCVVGAIIGAVAIVEGHKGGGDGALTKEASKACGKGNLQAIEWELTTDQYGEPGKQLHAVTCK